MKTVTLMVSTNPLVGANMLKHRFNPVVWASDNMETVAHYYEGAVIELEVKLLKSRQRRYIGSVTYLLKYKSGYGWGVTHPVYPRDALWYSFSREYLQRYLVSAREIYPDLTQWEEED